MNIRAIYFSLTLLVGLLSAPVANAFTIPKLTQAHTYYGKALEAELPSTIKIVVWNAYKGQKAGWQSDFEDLTQDADLFIMQEALSDPIMTDIFEDPGLSQVWDFATSFFTSGTTRTGVATGSIAEPTSISFLRSKHREPIVNTPKMTLFTRYKVKDSKKELLVVNLHAINFNILKITEALRHQLQEANKIIASHKGPVIFAGDFNTWLPSRTKVMMRYMKKAGLAHVLFSADPRTTKLDHVFARGVKLHKASVLDQYDTSDHEPLYLEISIL